MMILKRLSVGLAILVASYAGAATYQLPQDGSDVVGQMKIAYAKKGDTLTRLAMRHEVGYNEIRKANPTIRRKRLRTGTPVVIPTSHVIPDAERKGVIINLSDMRLFYFPNPDTVVTYPVAIGKSGWATPRGMTYIKQKKRHPTWTPPPSIRKEAAKRGRTLRDVYPAGPNNPLGTRALRLGFSGILIHGTNKPWSIGQRRSHGCIRMRRKDVEALFDIVDVGIPVNIVKQKTRQLPLSEALAGELALAKQEYLAANGPEKTIRKKRYKSERKRYKRKNNVASNTVVKHKIAKKYIIPADVFKGSKKAVKPAVEPKKRQNKMVMLNADLFSKN